ncbi:hypothetical protein JKF63_00712 [Porcisia hertigi]|uniref:Uncharacterized protein n=1 Tax=Porcisia hertigi TaxID=2761500 RepID=A0A836HC50_9TRYP|nr:hypothetical protein JKF63_00712 [Porcisia hertigi]
MDDLRASGLLPQPKTPEPQRLPSRGLGCYPESHISTAYHDAALLQAGEAVTCMYDEEEDMPHAQHSTGRYATLPHAEDDRANASTPRTMCQSRPRQCPELQYSHPFFIPSHSAHGSVVHVKMSPCSFVPSANDDPVVRRVRSFSCPSADRSVAPPRYSVEYSAGSGGGPGQSIGRHTTLLGGASSTYATISGTPSAGVATHPSVPLHSVWTSAAPSVVKGHGDAPSKSYDDADDRPSGAIHDVFCSHTGTTLPEATTSSVPRLTRLSLTSVGQSPAAHANWSIGRQTTLRCRDAYSDVHSDEGTAQEEVGNGMEPWVSDSRRIQCFADEAQALLPCSHDREEQQEEETLVAIPTSHHTGDPPSRQILVGSSPPIIWQPAPLSASFPASQLDFSDCCQDNAMLLSSAPMASTEDEVNDDDSDATRSIRMPPTGDVAFAERKASLAALGDAPRRNYVRLSCGKNPPPNDVVHQEGFVLSQTKGGAAGGAPTGVKSTLPVAASDARFQGLGASLGSNVGNCGGGRSESAAEWRYNTSIITPQGRSVQVDVPSQLRKSVYSTSTAAGETVAAQLAQISIHTSPTQKRLAFDEEEFAGRHSGGESPALTPAVPFVADDVARQRAWNSTAAAEGCASSSVAGFMSRGAGGPRELCGSRGPSGLQLLSSRKRCLAEMQATDTTQERGDTTLAARASKNSQGAESFLQCTTNDVHVATPCEKVGEGNEKSDSDSLMKALKRQRREELWCRRLQCPPPTAPNSTEDLIPAPVLPLDTDTAPCSPALSSYLGCAFHMTYSTQDQPPQGRLHCGDSGSWSQMSGIGYVTPASQSTSMGLWGVSATLSQVPPGAAAVSSVGSDSQVLTPLPTNVPPHPSLCKR